MELVMAVESSFVGMCTVIPSENSFGSSSIFEFSFINVIFSPFSTLSFKGILLESSYIVQLLGPELAFLWLGEVIIEISTIIGSIWENINSFALSFAVFEVSNVKWAVILVHLTKSVWLHSILT